MENRTIVAENLAEPLISFKKIGKIDEPGTKTTSRLAKGKYLSSDNRTSERARIGRVS